MTAFVIAETEQGARELCAGARTMADGVTLCVVGVPALTGLADKCIHIDVPADNIVDDAYPAVNAAFEAEGANVVLAEATNRTLSLVGRLAAHVGTSVITGVNSITDGVVDSLYFGGTGVRKARANGSVPMYVVGPGVFEGSLVTGTDVVVEIAFSAADNAVVKRGERQHEKSGANLAAADVIVCCGSGFSEETDLQLARDLADKIGGEMGCTRPVAESVKWMPKETYIGVTGQMSSPRLYVGIGVSGQMQHMIGVNSADTIVAINNDKNAPIFKQCDIGIVGDLKSVLPSLIEAL